MPLTPRQLNRATLARQLLLRRERLGAVDAIDRVVTVQAQEPASPYVALWNRVEGFDPADLDRAYASHAIVKSTSVRITLHAVTAADYPRFHEAMQPSLRASRLPDDRFAVAGFTFQQADDVIPELLAYASEPRSNQDMNAWLDARFGELPKPGVWWAIRTLRAVRPRADRRAVDVRAPAGVPRVALPGAERRSRAGPGAPRPPVSRGVRSGDDRGRREVRAGAAVAGEGGRGGDGRRGSCGSTGRATAPLLDVPGGVIPDEDTPAPPRLLGMWDEVLLAYQDRTRIIPEAIRKHLIRVNGDVLPALLVDGYVAGVWRPVDGGIEATALVPIDEDGLGRAGRRGPRPAPVPGGPRSGDLPPVRALVVAAARGRGPDPGRLG